MTAPFLATNDGGMSSEIRVTLPFSQVATARTSPAAVSRVTTVSGSTIGLMPVSKIAVTAHMALDPDMAWA